MWSSRNAVAPQPCGLRQMPHHPPRDVQPRRGRLVRPAPADAARPASYRRRCGHAARRPSAPCRRRAPAPTAARAAPPPDRADGAARRSNRCSRTAPARTPADPAASAAPRRCWSSPRAAARAWAIFSAAAERSSQVTLPGPPVARHLLRQHDRRIAGAAAGDQRVQRPRRRTARAEHPVIDLAQMARAADDQPLRLVARIALRIGIRLVLRRQPGSVASVIVPGIDRRHG